MRNLEVINIGDSTFEYPGDFTEKENKIINRYSNGNILHLFSGISKIGNVRIDFSCKEATHNGDVFNWLPFIENHFNTVIIDAPYNKNYANRYNKFNKIDRKQFIIFADAKKTTELFNHIIRLNPERIIVKSWNYYIVKGYKLLKGYVMYSGGYRKPTFLIIMEKDDK